MVAELSHLFKNRGRKFDVEAGQSILSEATSGNDVFMVVSGQVLLHSSSVQGRDFIIDVLKSGDIFGFAAWLDVGYRIGAVSLTQSSVAALDVPTVERAIREEPDLALSFIRVTVHQLVSRALLAADFALLNFSGRLAKLLLKVAEDQGVKIVKGSKFKCQFSQTLLARMLGASRETVNRQMQKWEENGILSKSGKNVCLLDPAGLRRAAEGAAED